MARRMDGLTLVELITAMAVAAIALGIGLPAFTTVMERVRAAAAYNSTTTALALARTAAVSKRRPVAVCPSANGLSCRHDGVWEDGWIVFLDPARSGQPDGALSVLHRFDPLPQGLHLHATDGRRLVRYQPNGSAAGTNVSLRLCVDQRHLGTVVVNNPGRARTSREKRPPPCPFALD